MDGIITTSTGPASALPAPEVPRTKGKKCPQLQGWSSGEQTPSLWSFALNKLLPFFSSKLKHQVPQTEPFLHLPPLPKATGSRGAYL